MSWGTGGGEENGESMAGLISQNNGAVNGHSFKSFQKENNAEGECFAELADNGRERW